VVVRRLDKHLYFGFPERDLVPTHPNVILSKGKNMEHNHHPPILILIEHRLIVSSFLLLVLVPRNENAHFPFYLILAFLAPLGQLGRWNQTSIFAFGPLN